MFQVGDISSVLRVLASCLSHLIHCMIIFQFFVNGELVNLNGFTTMCIRSNETG